jgi:hypothetical protein
MLIGKEQSGPPAGSKYSILHLEFINMIGIPEGTFLEKNTEVQGRIEIKLGDIGQWDDTLGTSLNDNDRIPCRVGAGILPCNIIF